MVRSCNPITRAHSGSRGRSITTGKPHGLHIELQAGRAHARPCPKWTKINNNSECVITETERDSLAGVSRMGSWDGSFLSCLWLHIWQNAELCAWHDVCAKRVRANGAGRLCPFHFPRWVFILDVFRLSSGKSGKGYTSSCFIFWDWLSLCRPIWLHTTAPTYCLSLLSELSGHGCALSHPGKLCISYNYIRIYTYFFKKEYTLCQKVVYTL